MKKSSAKTATTWPYPVSKQFYKKLLQKAELIFRDIGQGPQWVSALIPFIERYFDDRERPSPQADLSIRIVFASLRPDIDRAIERSAKARQRAIEHRKRKNITDKKENTGKQQPKTLTDAMTLSPPGSLGKQPMPQSAIQTFSDLTVLASKLNHRLRSKSIHTF